MFDLQSDHHTAATWSYFRVVESLKRGGSIDVEESIYRRCIARCLLTIHMMPSYTDLESWGIGDGAWTLKSREISDSLRSIVGCFF